MIYRCAVDVTCSMKSPHLCSRVADVFLLQLSLCYVLLQAARESLPQSRAVSVARGTSSSGGSEVTGGERGSGAKAPPRAKTRQLRSALRNRATPAPSSTVSRSRRSADLLRRLWPATSSLNADTPRAPERREIAYHRHTSLLISRLSFQAHPHPNSFRISFLW
ncbi:hypothetical protein NDU88_001168 [Pleurodeles waltl]|uniref:Uncharacterized protein n=1 Tax=Pleurodeles waltl TaxID=8319 RepID=A0AAV7SZI4_PLEWA|nr:hypothetical protein NDU88_001168 [Pleurodeles waltl]